MNLLLKEDVEGLGYCGDEVKVRDGYGRNFLIPQGKAILATPRNIKQFNHQKMIVQGKVKKIINSATELAEKIGTVNCTIKKKHIHRDLSQHAGILAKDARAPLERYSPTTGFRSTPISGISISTTSPALMTGVAPSHPIHITSPA